MLHNLNKFEIVQQFFHVLFFKRISNSNVILKKKVPKQRDLPSTEVRSLACSSLYVINSKAAEKHNNQKGKCILGMHFTELRHQAQIIS